MNKLFDGRHPKMPPVKHKRELLAFRPLVQSFVCQQRLYILGVQAITQAGPRHSCRPVVPSVDGDNLPVAMIVSGHRIDEDANCFDLTSSTVTETNNAVSVLSFTSIPVMHTKFLQIAVEQLDQPKRRQRRLIWFTFMVVARLSKAFASRRSTVIRDLWLFMFFKTPTKIRDILYVDEGTIQFQAEVPTGTHPLCWKLPNFVKRLVLSAAHISVF